MNSVTQAVRTDAFRVPPGPIEKYDSSEDLFAWMKENFARYGDIYKASVFGSDIYVVNNPEYCERILRWNWRNYTRSGQVVKRISFLLGNGLIASNGEFWASQRRMIQPVFAKGAIDNLVTMIGDANVDLLQNWKAAARRRETVNVTRDISHLVLKITLIAIFGADYPAVAPHFDVLAEGSERNLGFAQAFRPLGKIILQIAEQRRRAGAMAADFLGGMMQARDRARGEPMPDPQLVKEAMTLVVAGHETTASLLNWMWYLLSKHPQAHVRLSDEFDRLPWSAVPNTAELPRYAYTRQVIDEALRLYPPLWLMTRRALHDDRLDDYFVPAGTEIYISPYLVQHNPDLWEAPEGFDPDRMSPDETSKRHELALCPFGAGPRNCIGEFFARVEMQIHLMLFAKELRLRYDEEKPPEIAAGMNLLSRHDLIMLPEIKTPAPI